MKNTQLLALVTSVLLTSCAPIHKYDIALDPELGSSCPGSVDVLLGVVFENDNPVRIAGGRSVDSRHPNDKLAKRGDDICWVGIVLDADGSIDLAGVKFAVLFGPADNPNPTNHWQHLNVNGNAPVGLAYKYSIWTEFSDIENPPSFMDPRIVVHD